MTEKLSTFDVADYLDNEETIAQYLCAILEEGDAELLISAIGDVAKARGMSQIAQTSGLGRESLYKALTPGAKPRFETIVKVLNALGVQLQLVALPKKKPIRKSSRGRIETPKDRPAQRP